MPLRPSVLLALPQMPQDPASGAARSLNTICEMLAESGFVVRAIASTASEGGKWQEPVVHLKSLGLRPEVHKRPSSGKRPEITFDSHGISYRLLDTARLSLLEWPKLYNTQFDLMFDQELDHFRPDILFTFGGSPGEVRRRKRARRRGIQVVFGLRNLGYLAPGSLDEVDAILATSQFITERYRSVLGIESTPLPTPMDLDAVFAEDRQPIFFTMVNPSFEKGVMFLARLAEEVSVRRPTTPFLVIESRGTGGLLAGAGAASGFDLQRHENILVSAPVPAPKDIYAGTRVLLVPSVWEEPAARVAAEALVNGIPPMVSDRGGIAETLNGAGFVLPIPPEITAESRAPVSASAVAPWVELILRLAEDEAFYQEESRRALEAGRLYHREVLAPRYVEFFRRVLEG